MRKNDLGIRKCIASRKRIANCAKYFGARQLAVRFHVLIAPAEPLRTLDPTFPVSPDVETRAFGTIAATKTRAHAGNESAVERDHLVARRNVALVGRASRRGPVRAPADYARRRLRYTRIHEAYGRVCRLDDPHVVQKDVDVEHHLVLRQVSLVFVVQQHVRQHSER